MPLPSVGTTNFFGDLTENIYKHVGKEASNLLYQIHLALVDGTPATTGSGSPVDTGALKANWHKGIRPNSNYIKRVPGERVAQPPVTFKNYGFNHTYYLWNNTPYLSYVNDGIAGKAGITPNSSVNINFVQKAIAVGEKNAKQS